MPKDGPEKPSGAQPAAGAPDEPRPVRVGKQDPVELELVTTAALEKILKTEGGKTRSEIRKLAAGSKDGVLARDAATGRFSILSEAELKKAAAAPPPDGPRRSGVATAPPLSETVLRKADELSLASTQFLRKAVKAEDKAAEAAKPKASLKKDKAGGFNPYDNN